MTPQEFRQYWHHQYPDCPPIGYRLRDAYPDRWLRIHSLPDSKRYAETDDEYKEILKRHNTILSDLIGKNKKYVLVTSGYSETPAPVRSYTQLRFLAGDSKEVFSIAKHELDGDENPFYWHFFMTNRNWEEHSTDELLKLVADNDVANILFVGVEQNCVYHPYDGGADIIVASKLLRDQKKQEYTAWLSSHPYGL